MFEFALNASTAIIGLLLAGLLASYLLQRRMLAAFVQRHLSRGHTDQECALHLAAFICSSIQRKSDPYFISRIFGPLGASPLSVLNAGGCCSGIHRLYIAALDTIQINAAQITLYHRKGNAQHCLVEVRINGSPMIIDVGYGIYYDQENNQSVELEDLQRGIRPRFLQIPGADRFGYPSNSYYDFDFRLTKTANWTKTFFRRFVYSVLKRATNGRIDRLRLHPIFEWPQILLAMFIFPVFILVRITSIALV